MTISGWGVYRQKPWHLVGIFPTKEEAERVAVAHGEGYFARQGEGQEGSDDFLWFEDVTEAERL